MLRPLQALFLNPQEKGVNQMYIATEDNIETECRNIVYIVRPKMKMMKIIAKHIRHLERHGALPPLA